MPSRNRIKTYIEDGYYHVYNRGVNKNPVFLDSQDYNVFLFYLKSYLIPKDTDELSSIIANEASTELEKHRARTALKRNNFHNKIDLIAYSLMPNHYHMLVHQETQNDMEIFMKSLMTRYTQYFNRRHKRVGPLFQDRYKAVLVETDEQLLYLTRYIHRNLIELNSSTRTVLKNLRQLSSYPVYLKQINQPWIKPDIILNNFSSSGFNSYQSFVEDTDEGQSEKTIILLPHLAQL